MKRARWWVLVGAGMAAGVAVGLATVDTGMLPGRDGQDQARTGLFEPAEAGREACDDACVRSRGAAALTALSQRPAP